MARPLAKRLDELERGVGANDKWRVYAIDRYDDDTDEGAIAAYEAEHGPLEHGPKVLRVLLHPFCNRGE